jgi:hypothetical protein
MIEAYVRKGQSEIHWEGNDKKEAFWTYRIVVRKLSAETSFISRVKEEIQLWWNKSNNWEYWYEYSEGFN